MTTLGDVLTMARRSTAGFEAWMTAADPALAAATRTAAAVEATTPHGLARVAVADFSRRASEEDWSALLREVRDAADPGAACLAAMLSWWLAQTTHEAREGAGGTGHGED